MKNIPKSKTRAAVSDDMPPEYEFDYRKAKPNRFASRLGKERIMVVVDPDVSEVFKSSETVNAVLRALIATMPVNGKQKTPRKQPLRKAKRTAASRQPA